ncbi:MAG: hypothetical protein Q9178_005416 [Gyalolechia marmorata]
MHFHSAAARLPVPTLLLVICFLLRDVAALGHEFQPLLKRQGCNSAEIRSQCLTVGSDPSECIDFICDSCTDLDPAIASCCQRSGDLNKAQCISDNLDTDSTSPSTTDSNDASITRPTSSFQTTTAPADANSGCSSLLDKQSSCKAATPGFASIIAWSSQASCFCYSSSSFAPRTFDNYYSSCLSYLETADTELYSSLTIGDDVAVSTPCAFIGDLEEATTRGGDIPSRTPSPGSVPTGAGNPRPTPVAGSGGISSRVGVCVF